AWLVCCALGAYVAWTLSHPGRKNVNTTPDGFNYRDVQFQSTIDHLNLYGWFLDAGSDKTVVMVHGYRDNRLQDQVPALGVARGLVDHGYNFLTFDLRDAGQSDGSVTTIGAFEVRDALGAIGFVKSLRGPGQHIVLLGYSMGAATALLAAAQDHDVQAVIADSAFSDLYPYLQGNLTHWSRLPAFPFTPLILSIEPALTGADPRLADPMKAMPNISAPILFIHGLADNSIPYENSQQLRAAATNPMDQLWLVPGADHIQSFATDPGGYWDHVLPFLANAVG
ncbi:MAG TPA: alpha/beta fold hydrolase, partial [Chloroflexota bacterium]|nr:alpha/beta fold hydrolase [Chloroflexota bacterium]